MRTLRLTVSARRLRSICLLLLFCLPVTASAWNATGHRLVTRIAWDNLSDEGRQAATALLSSHPDHARWLQKVVGNDVDRAVFIEASTWADQLRGDQRFYTAGLEPATPPLPGFTDMERHLDWHFVNRPFDAGRQVHESNHGLLDQQLTVLSRTLASRQAPLAQRAYALVWLIHLVADAHQPLHASAWPDTSRTGCLFKEQDRFVNPAPEGKRHITLHAFWDNLPGPTNSSRPRLDAAARQLIALFDHPPSSTPQRWLDESWQLAREHGYPACTGTISAPEISEAFRTNAEEIARRRIAEAGYRLADLLDDALR